MSPSFRAVSRLEFNISQLDAPQFISFPLCRQDAIRPAVWQNIDSRGRMFRFMMFRIKFLRILLES